MIKTVLVTGGGGFIGSHIIELLLAKGYNIVVLERTPESLKRIENLVSKIKVYFSSKNDPEDIFKENKIDCVIHLAAKYIKKHETIKDVEEIVGANVEFSSQLAELCREYKVKHFINTGTFFEYKITKEPLREGDPKEPYDLYAASKSAFTVFLKYFAKSSGFKATNLYLFPPFGDRDNEKLMAFLVKGLVGGEKIDFSGGEQSWNFTYVKDTALAYLKVIENFDNLNQYEEFNVGCDRSISIKEIVQKLEEISGRKLNINWGAKPYIENEIMFVNCDNSKLQKMLGWKQEYGLDKGLKATYEYFTSLYKETK